MKIDLSETVGVIIAKLLEYKGIDMTSEEIMDFWGKLKDDPDFLKAYGNCVRNED